MHKVKEITGEIRKHLEMNDKKTQHIKICSMQLKQC